MVPGDTADRYLRTHQVHSAVQIAAAFHLGKHFPGDIEDLQYLVIPALVNYVIHHRTRRVCPVGDMNDPAGQFPKKPRIDGPEQQLALFSPLAGAGDGVKDPFELRSAEISVDTKSGLLSYKFV